VLRHHRKRQQQRRRRRAVTTTTTTMTTTTMTTTTTTTTTTTHVSFLMDIQPFTPCKHSAGGKCSHKICSLGRPSIVKSPSHTDGLLSLRGSNPETFAPTLCFLPPFGDGLQDGPSSGVQNEADHW
jgi:hypothetical protein